MTEDSIQKKVETLQMESAVTRRDYESFAARLGSVEKKIESMEELKTKVAVTSSRLSMLIAITTAILIAVILNLIRGVMK